MAGVNDGMQPHAVGQGVDKDAVDLVIGELTGLRMKPGVSIQAADQAA